MTTEEYTKILYEIRRELFELRSKIATQKLSEEEYKRLKERETEIIKEYKKLLVTKLEKEKSVKNNKRGR